MIKYLKVFLILVVSAFSLYSMETNVKPMFTGHAERTAREFVEGNLLLQKNIIIKGIEDKQKQLDSIAAAIADKDDSDLISGMLEGNLTSFLWLEYIDETGVPKAIAGQRSDTFTITASVPPRSTLDAGISLTDLAESSLKDNILITASPETLMPKLTSDGMTIAESTPLDETLHLIVAKEVKSSGHTYYIIAGAIILLALFGLWSVFRMSKRVDIPSITSFFEQVEKGNTELRFELQQSDPLHAVKHSINVFLDESQKMLREYRHERSQLLSFSQSMDQILNEQIIVKNYQSFLAFLYNDLEISRVHLFLKNAGQVVHFHNLETETLSNDETTDKLFSFKEKSILDEFDLSRVLRSSETGMHSHIVYPLAPGSVLLIPKSAVSHIKLDILEIFVRLFSETVSLHTERINAIRSKVQCEKHMSALNTSIIVTDSTGHALFTNELGKMILPPETGTDIFEILRSLNINVDSLKESLGSGKFYQSRASVGGRPHLVSVSPLFLQEGTLSEIVFSFTDISEIYNEYELKGKENENAMRRMEMEVNKLSQETIKLKTQIDTYENTIQSIKSAPSADASIEGITVHMAAALSRSAKMLRLLAKELFDEKDKKMAALVRKELTAINFLMRDLMLVGKQPEVNSDLGDINDIIKKSFDLARNELKNKKCAMDASITNDIEELSFDKTLMSLAFYNIFLSAAQHCGENSRLVLRSFMDDDNSFMFTLTVDPASQSEGTLAAKAAAVMEELTQNIIKMHNGVFRKDFSQDSVAYTIQLS